MADPVVAHLDVEHRVFPRHMTAARVAWACLTTFVSASATMKYALASISLGKRSVVTSTSTHVEACHDGVDAGSQTAVRQHRRKDAVRELAHSKLRDGVVTSRPTGQRH